MTALATRRCVICGQTLETRDPKGYGAALREHTRTVHPELFRWQRRMRVTAVIAVGLGATLGIVSAIFLQNVGYNNWAEAVLFAAVLAPFAGLALVGRFTVKKYQSAWKRDHGTTPLSSVNTSPVLNLQSSSLEQPIPASADQRIISSVNNVARQLDIPRFVADGIKWQDYSNIKPGLLSFRRSGPPILVPYDGCVFEKGTIILPLSSRDKLDTEEWIPLIISELLYQQKFRAKRRIGLLIRIVPLTIIYLILPLALWRLGIINLNGTVTTSRGSPTPFWLAFYGVYSGTALIFAMILQIILGFRFEKKLRLMADQQTATMTQKQLFLSGLGKMGRAFPELMREKRPSISYPPDRPGNPRRISIVEATGLIGYSMSSS